MGGNDRVGAAEPISAASKMVVYMSLIAWVFKLMMVAVRLHLLHWHTTSVGYFYETAAQL